MKLKHSESATRSEFRKSQLVSSNSGQEWNFFCLLRAFPKVLLLNGRLLRNSRRPFTKCKVRRNKVLRKLNYKHDQRHRSRAVPTIISILPDGKIVSRFSLPYNWRRLELPAVGGVSASDLASFNVGKSNTMGNMLCSSITVTIHQFEPENALCIWQRLTSSSNTWRSHLKRNASTRSLFPKGRDTKATDLIRIAAIFSNRRQSSSSRKLKFIRSVS